jgi:N-acetylmuramoyl-L-alanine amidase
LGIAFIGNFNDDKPSEAMMEETLRFFKDALTLGKLSEDYKIHARQDVLTAGPGNEIYKIMQSWLRYSKTW